MEYIMITGVSSGIGLDTARQLIKAGYFVFGSVRTPGDAEKVTQALGANFQALVFDVRQTEQINTAAETVSRRCGQQGLTALVNNAGVAVSGPLELLTPDDMTFQLDVNVVGVMRVTQAFLPLLGTQRPRSSAPGKIINISSISGALSSPFIGPYCVSKFALEALSDSWRRELLLYGIDVVVIQPGAIKTPIWDKAVAGNQVYPGTIYEAIFKKNEKRIRKMEADGLPVERVSALIHKVIVAKRPKTRYLIARNKVSFWFISRLLPDRVIDFAIRRTFQKWLKKSEAWQYSER